MSVNDNINADVTVNGPAKVATSTVEIPTLLWGKRCGGEGETCSTTYPNGAKAITRNIDTGIANALETYDRMALARMPLQEIVAFLNRVGSNWKNQGYVRRRLYTTQLRTFLGYSEEAADAEADRIAALLTAHSRAYDVIEAELGSRFVVDEWVRREDSWIRAYPRGLVAHVLPGNVPIANIVSIVRALLTKNVSVAKLPSLDMFTTTAFALSLLDVDAEHPVARSLSVVYWDHDNNCGKDVVGFADSVVAWGGEEAVRWAHATASASASFTGFGPKRSMALVAAHADMARTARGIAHDVSLYDQHACFSTQQVFTDGDDVELVAELEKELDLHADLLPPSFLSEDQAALVNLVRREEDVLGHRVAGRDDLGWTIIRCDPRDIREHPLCRTLLVHRVDDLQSAYEYVGRDVQTVTGAPWDMLAQHRDELALRGVSRFAEVGLSNVFRVGGTHDALNPLQGLVRIVSMDTEAATHGKGMIRRLDQTELLRAGELRELVL
jgi:long-chain-fatty-acyl-CoA reductase